MCFCSEKNDNYRCLNERNQDELSQQGTQRQRPPPYVIKQLKITLCLTIGNLTTGYSMGWAVPIASKLKDPKQTPLQNPLPDVEMAWIITALIIGAIVGSITSGFAANKIGRKHTLLLASSSNLIGYIVIATAGNVTTLLAGRVIAGVTAGSIALVNVVYLGEISSPNTRGALTTITGITHVTGSLLAYSLGPYVTFAASCYVCLGLSCVHTLALCYVPESPVYQVMKGKLNAARLTLHDLGRTEDIDVELKIINEHAKDTLLLQTKDDRRENAPKPWRLIIEKKNLKAFLITIVLFCLQVGGGIIAVISFATTIFKSAQSSVDSNVGIIVLGLTELCGLIMTPLLIERCGRRVMLLMSLGCCSLCMGVLGTYFYLEVNHYMMIRSIRWLPLILLMICLFTFNIGLGIVPNVLTGEMYSPPFRSIGSSVSMALAWSVVLGTGSGFHYTVTVLRNHGLFWMYSAVNAVGLVFTLLVVPETKGKSLAEIGCLLGK